MIKNAFLLSILGFIVILGTLILNDKFGKTESFDILEKMVDDYIIRAKFLSYIIREPVEMEDEISSSVVLDIFKSNFKDVINLNVITNDGTILASLDSTMVLNKFKGMMLKEKEVLKLKEDNKYYIGVPVKSGKLKIGEIHITLDTNKFVEKKESIFDINKIVYSAIGFVVFFVIGVIIGIKPKKEIVLEKQDTSQLNKEIEKLKEIITNLKKEEAETIKILEEKKGEIEKLEKDIINKKNEYESLEEEFKSSSLKKKEIEDLKTELAALEVKLSDKRSELEELEKNIQSFKGKFQVQNEEEALMSNVIDSDIDARIEEKKKQEVELTQRIVAKRREEITISARIEAKKKELLELEKKIESLKKQI